ncbi:PAS domain S-box protein [Brevibacillus fluminis]|uniref:PAS domain S-box protein n=1 Tax=Brevibacillus fluminis TaxID=511487 RepID=A0A3M8DII4_9BACL|nr:SpoIIE family protein phosphatase [Brevibacillus fluminis]RNB87271.1 PAS domain S-box protein [Brevibacillus fluminis]
MSSNLGDLLTYLHALPEFMLVQDEHGGWIAANGVALRLLQLEGVVYQGRCTRELLQEAGWEHELWTCFDEACASAWQRKAIVECELPFRYDDGRATRVFVLKMIPIIKQAGELNYLVIQGRDNTVRTLMEEEITLAGKVFESVSDGIFVTDVEGTILFVNPAFTAVTGYSTADVIGKNPRVLKSGKQGAKFYQHMWNSLLEDGYFQGEIYNRRKNGQVYPESLTINAIKDKMGHTTHYVAIFRDISEREQVRKDVMLTGKIQRKFLPPDYQDQWVTIRSFFKPSHYVSGDLYDYKWLMNSEKLFGYLIDVMGHGLSTALQASVLRVLFLQAASLGLSLQEKVSWINRESMRYFTEDTFAAAICFEFDLRARTFTYVSCGINYFLAATKEMSGVIKAPGMFLALSESAVYEQHVLPIHPGDSFYLMTDGVYDKMPAHYKQELPCFDEMTDNLKKLIFTQKHKDDASAILFNIHDLPEARS